MSAITAEEFKQIIIDRLQATDVSVTDESGGCGQSFSVVIVSDIFEKKNKLARHRIVNNALKEIIANIHAFAQKTYTVEEWQKVVTNK